MTSACVAIEPMTMASPSSVMSVKPGMRRRSTTFSGALSRIRRTGSRLWPPARTLASSPASARAERASSSESGAT